MDVVVTKAPRAFLWRDSRVHLDEVEGLGTFVEIETAIGTDDGGRAMAEHQSLKEKLSLTDLQAIGCSYRDLATTGLPSRTETAEE